MPSKFWKKKSKRKNDSNQSDSPSPSPSESPSPSGSSISKKSRMSNSAIANAPSTPVIHSGFIDRYQDPEDDNLPPKLSSNRVDGSVASLASASSEMSNATNTPDQENSVSSSPTPLTSNSSSPVQTSGQNTVQTPEKTPTPESSETIQPKAVVSHGLEIKQTDTKRRSFDIRPSSLKREGSSSTTTPTVHSNSQSPTSSAPPVNAFAHLSNVFGSLTQLTLSSASNPSKIQSGTPGTPVINSERSSPALSKTENLDDLLNQALADLLDARNTLEQYHANDICTDRKTCLEEWKSLENDLKNIQTLAGEEIGAWGTLKTKAFQIEKLVMNADDVPLL